MLACLLQIHRVFSKQQKTYIRGMQKPLYLKLSNITEAQLQSQSVEKIIFNLGLLSSKTFIPFFSITFDVLSALYFVTVCLCCPLEGE